MQVRMLTRTGLSLGMAFITDTELICIVYRLLGAKIGRRCKIGTLSITEWDLVEIGDDCIIAVRQSIGKNPAIARPTTGFAALLGSAAQHMGFRPSRVIRLVNQRVELVLQCSPALACRQQSSAHPRAVF
jgi:hypothetical protein